MINPCSFCDARCCKSYTITTTIFDLVRIANATNKPIESFTEFHEPRLLSYDPDLVIDTTDGYECYLLGIKSHPCVFLNVFANRCTVHKDAPLSCKRYPFTLSGSHNPRFCSFASSLLYRFCSPDIGLTELEKELALHKSFVRKWNKKKGTRNECLEFLISATSGSKD